MRKSTAAVQTQNSNAVMRGQAQTVHAAARAAELRTSVRSRVACPVKSMGGVGGQGTAGTRAMAGCTACACTPTLVKCAHVCLCLPAQRIASMQAQTCAVTSPLRPTHAEA